MSCFVDDPMVTGEYRNLLLSLFGKLKITAKGEGRCLECATMNAQMKMADCELFQEKDLSSIGFPSNFIFTKTG
jgi:hypothetical protein